MDARRRPHRPLLAQRLAISGCLPPPSPTELLRIVRLPEATHLSGISEDGLRRYHADKIIQLSPRAVGMRVIDALMIGAKIA